MTNKMIKIISTLLLMLLSLNGFAEEPSPFEVTMTVPDTSQGTLNHTLPEAMKTLLIKLSENKDITKQKPIEEALKQAMDYVSQYRYQDKQLIVNFDENGINALLTQTQPVKTEEQRQDVLLWLVVDGALLTENQYESEFYQALQKAAAENHIPFFLPVMDLSESQQVDVADVEGFSKQVIEYSQSQYGVKNVVMGVIKQQDVDTWQGDWFLAWQDDEYRGTLQGLTPEHLLQPLMHTLAMYLQDNKRQAETAHTTHISKIHIKGIDGLDQYADVVNYVRSIPSVEDVEVVDVLTDAIALKVTYRGDKARLHRLLTQSDQLVMMPGDDPFDEVLTYHWNAPWQDS